MRGAPTRNMMKTLSSAAVFWIHLLFLSLAGPELAATCAIRSERLRSYPRRRELSLREWSGQW